MGILSRIFGGKKSEETIQAIEEEMIKLKNKTNAEMIAIFGVGGRLKGLPLIYVADDEPALKKFAARLFELIGPINFLSDERILRDFVINYADSILFYKQILTNIGYFAIFQDKDATLTLKQWAYKKESVLKELLHE